MSGDIVEVLPVSLSFVRVPRSRVQSLYHPILKQILLPDPTFLNVTCNELELSVFAPESVVHDFAPIVRRDRRKLRRQAAHPSTRKRRAFEPVEISSEKWKVIQIPSPDSTGARVQELSAPVAAAGISILYQSSHQSDFIFVKETHLNQVLVLLQNVGFTPTDADGTPATFASSAPGGTPYELIADLAPGSGAVLTRTHSSSASPVGPRPRSNTGSSFASLASALSRRIGALSMSPLPSSSSVLEGPDREPTLPEASAEMEANADEVFSARQVRTTSAESESYAPAPTDVRILSPDLTCVGLPNEVADAWSLKIVKLIAFPDTILPNSGTTDANEELARSLELDSPFHEFEAQRIQAVTSPRSSSSSSASGSSSSSYSSDSDGDAEDEGAEPLPLPSPALRQCNNSGTSSSLPSSIDSQPSLPNLPILSTASKPIRPSLLHNNTITSSTSILSSAAPVSTLSPSQPVDSSLHDTSSSVPFFSFTRAPEGSSLATSVALLAALFPPGERHMLTCGDAVDLFDSAPPAPLLSRGRAARMPAHGDDAESESESENGRSGAGVLKRCLQIDLRRFGLDKHGLVNRFSRVLEEYGIDHMYSSTYKTANMLVARRDAKRARALLSLC